MVEVLPIAAPLGAQVRCGDVRKLEENARALLRAALIEHLVLVVRDQTLSDQELIAFGRTFGELDAAPLAYTDGHKARSHEEVIIVSNVKEGGVPIGVLGDAEVVWHSDNSYRETPLAVSMLYGIEIPASGGETGFVNMYLAHETLPSRLRAKIEGGRLKHDATYNSAGALRRGFQPTSDVRACAGSLASDRAHTSAVRPRCVVSWAATECLHRRIVGRGVGSAAQRVVVTCHAPRGRVAPHMAARRYPDLG